MVNKVLNFVITLIFLLPFIIPSNCKENRGIYSALHLDKVFNVSALLNTSVVSRLTD